LTITNNRIFLAGGPTKHQSHGPGSEAVWLLSQEELVVQHKRPSQGGKIRYKKTTNRGERGQRGKDGIFKTVRSESEVGHEGKAI
jgi:hypothetical protein